MAQFWDDFTGQTVSQFPSGWSIPRSVDRTHSGSAIIVSDAGASNGIGCQLPGSQAQKGIIKDEIGAPATAVDVRFRMRRTGGLAELSQAGCLIRASDITNWTNFAVYFTGGDAIRTARVTVWTTTVLATSAAIPGWADDTAYRRVRVKLAVNGDYQVFAWADTAEEPTTPVLTGNAASLTETGKVGLYWFDQSSQCICDWIAVGTDGDVPPAGPIGGLTAPTLTAPANLSTGVALRPTFTWS